jgi:hypothetical protein
MMRELKKRGVKNGEKSFATMHRVKEKFFPNGRLRPRMAGDRV